MSPVAVETHNADGSVCNTANREEAIPRDFPISSATPSAMRDFCERHYAKILPFMVKKAHSQKLKNVCSRLTFSEDTKQETESASRHRKRKRRGGKQKCKSHHPRSGLGAYSLDWGAKRQEQQRRDAIELKRSYVTYSSESQRENKQKYRRHERVNSSDELLESKDNAGGRYQKRQSRRAQNHDGEDLSKPYDEESTTSFTRRINKFVFPKRIRMPSTIKTYDGIGDPEDHLKTFTTAAKLPPESVNSLKDMRKKFLAYYLQHKRYTRDPVELHHVKQREGESTEAFMERYTSESLMFKGASEIMRISGFMHGITHPGLIKRLNDNIPKTVDEMMSVTKAFIHGEKAAANQSKRKGKP
ncbi:hypothetical protein Tco_0729872 [Tanacetum coccineum]|uniref:Reverse transcriptase domain-containing protein n=1 Tax=Tanacetum coccineum TaxID=301880 RepID=A0ABQ4YRD2_9ASTR